MYKGVMVHPMEVITGRMMTGTVGKVNGGIRVIMDNHMAYQEGMATMKETIMA